MPGESKWANLFPEFGRLSTFEESYEQEGQEEQETNQVELVEIVDDDAASSVCLDDDTPDVGLEDAIKVVNEISNKKNLTEYDEYTQKVAQGIIARERLVRRRTLAVPNRSPYGYVELLEKVELDDSNGLGSYKNSIFTEGDIESLMTLDIDTLDDTLTLKSKSGLRRQIRPRDLYLITLGGFIGLAFFQDVAKTLWLSGPVYVFVTFVLSAGMFYLMMAGVAEMISFVPHDAGYTGIVNMVVDPSLAVSFGICYWIQACLRVPYEVILTVSLFSTFPILNQPDHSSMVWLTFVLMLVIGFNFVYARIWGRFNAYTALVSVALIGVLNIYNLLLDTGHIGPLYNYIGAKYWETYFENGMKYGPFKSTFGERKIPGGLGGLLEFWLAWTTSAYGFTGLDVVFVSTAEIRNPRKSVPKTMKVLPWRLIGVFSLTLLIVLFVTDSNDSALVASTKTGSEPMMYEACKIAESRWSAFSGIYLQSAWVAAFLEQKVCYAAFAAIAFFIYIGCLAAAGHLFVASRALHSLSQIGILWKRLGATSRNGVPFVAVLVSSIFAFTTYMTAGANAAEYYLFLSKWVIGALWLVWSVLCLTYYKFYQVVKSNPNINRCAEEYPYRAPLQPYASVICGSICLVFALFAAVPDMLSRSGFSVEAFMGYYSPIFMFIVIFGVHKLVYKTSFIKKEDVNLEIYRTFMDRQEWEEDRVYSKSFRGALWQVQHRTKAQWEKKVSPLFQSRNQSKND